MMSDIAVVNVTGDTLEVLVCDDLALAPDLENLGLAPHGPDHWHGHVAWLEPVCALLDRHGFHWGVYTPSAPRTFGERLFAECPDEIAGELYAAVRHVLARCTAAKLELAALDAAWRSHGDGADRYGVSDTG